MGLRLWLSRAGNAAGLQKAPPGQAGRIERTQKISRSHLSARNGAVVQVPKQILCLILIHRPVSQVKVASSLSLDLLDPPRLARRGFSRPPSVAGPCGAADSIESALGFSPDPAEKSPEILFPSAAFFPL
jgi:hypothetical protein